MKKSIDALHAGLLEISNKSASPVAGSHSYMLGYVGGLTADLIEGDALTKKRARRELQRIIARGRCLLYIADFEAGLKKGARAICGDPAYAEPCKNTSAADCGDCIALPSAAEVQP